MATITYTGRLVTVTCWCGIEHAIPEQLDRHAAETGAAVHCPLGHPWVVGKSLKKLLAEERERTARAQRRARANRELLEAEERSHAATRGHLTRAKKRIGNGVCPCCNRHFTNVERHMASKHPGFTA